MIWKEWLGVRTKRGQQSLCEHRELRYTIVGVLEAPKVLRKLVFLTTCPEESLLNKGLP